MLLTAKVAFVPAWSIGLASGLVYSSQRDPASLIDEAMQRLQSLWPETPPEMILAATQTIPILDEGAALQSKLQARLNANEAFVFAAFGSSVSAGHDNIFNQSWPYELQRLLQPTFQAIGFDFEVRQRAAGGYGEMPFAAGCLEARAGEGVDALSWEWGMFNDAPCEGHHFLTEASRMDRKPVVFAFADTSLNFDGLSLDKDQRKAKRRELLRHHDDAEFNGAGRIWRPNEWFLKDDFVTKEEVQNWKSKEDVYVRRMPNGQYMTHLQMSGVAQEFESMGLGLYPVSVGESSKYVIGNPWYQAREKAFNINWHPGPLGHTLIASQLGYYILAQLRAVVAAPDGSIERTRGPSLDNPLVGKPLTGKQNPPACGHLISQQCFTGMTPHSSGASLEGRRVGSAADSWTHQISKQVVGGGESIDQRWAFAGNQSSGSISFKIQVSGNEQYAIFCGAPCGWWCNQPTGYVSSKSQRWWNQDTVKGFVDRHGMSTDELLKKLGFPGGPPRKSVSDLDFTVDGKAVTGGDLLQLHQQLFDKDTGAYCPGCDNPADVCQPVAKLSKGEHTLSLKVQPRTFSDPDMVVEVLELLIVG